MLSLNGTVVNVLEVDERTSKDGTETYGGYWQVQIMGENALKNGHSRVELVTLKTDRPADFKACMNQQVTVPVGVFASGGKLVYFLPSQSAPAKVSDKGRVSPVAATS